MKEIASGKVNYLVKNTLSTPPKLFNYGLISLVIVLHTLFTISSLVHPMLVMLYHQIKVLIVYINN